MTICAGNSVICMKTTVSLTNSNVYGVVTTSKLILHSLECIGLTVPRHVLTGSYHNYFRIYDTDTLNDILLQADKSAFKAKKVGGPLASGKLGAKNGPRGLRDAIQLDTVDFNKKILHMSWHPRENTIAVSHSLLSCYMRLTLT